MVDACLVISFGNAGRLDLLFSTPQRRIAITPVSAGEVVRPPASLALAEAIKAGDIAREAIDLDNPAEQDALHAVNAIPAFRDRGEAEALALAVSRGWVVGSDDAAVRSYAMRAIGPARIAGALDFLVWAVRDGRLTSAGGEALLGALDVGPGIAARLVKASKVFADLI